MAIAEETEMARKPVNSYASIYIGKNESGEYYNVYTSDGNAIKEEEKVTGQGTIYIGNAYAGDDVFVEKIPAPDEEDES